MTGKQTSSVYRLIEKDPSMRKLFHDYMRDISKTVEEMTTVFDLSEYSRVCDIGGVFINYSDIIYIHLILICDQCSFM